MVTIAARKQITICSNDMDISQRAVVLGVVILLLLLALVNQRDNAESIIAASSENSLSLFDVTYKDDETTRPDLSPWEGCTIGTITARQPKTLKAFWVPMFPDSDAGIIGTMVKMLTNSPFGHKNYYAKGPDLKKCKSSSSVTISCEQIHPVVGSRKSKLAITKRKSCWGCAIPSLGSRPIITASPSSTTELPPN